MISYKSAMPVHCRLDFDDESAAYGGLGQPRSEVVAVCLSSCRFLGGYSGGAAAGIEAKSRGAGGSSRRFGWRVTRCCYDAINLLWLNLVLLSDSTQRTLYDDHLLRFTISFGQG
jgi:hypothetical protein